MYKKLDCVCGHPYNGHNDNNSGTSCFIGCGGACKAYDPAGHNPELINVLCPCCRLARLERPAEMTYICPVCQYVMLESQVKELVG